MKKKKLFENIIHGIFLILGTITVGFVLVITIYLIVSGIPAIAQIGLFNFLFGLSLKVRAMKLAEAEKKK